MSPWEEAAKRVIYRKNWFNGKQEPLDAGVTFFVEALEYVG